MRFSLVRYIKNNKIFVNIIFIVVSDTAQHLKPITFDLLKQILQQSPTREIHQSNLKWRNVMEDEN